MTTRQYPPPRAAAARFSAARDTYTASSVQTVTPAQLVVMIYDGMLRHLDVAAAAIENGNLQMANDRLTKAQALLFELEVGLDTSAWPAGAGLAQLYSFVAAELVTANVTKDTARITNCRDLLAPLAEAWRQAALTVAEQPVSMPQMAGAAL